MRTMFLRLLAGTILIASIAYGQSLGDVARENRQKKPDTSSSVTPKVITNKDFPKDPEANQEPDEEQTTATAPDHQNAGDLELARHRSEERQGLRRSLQHRAAEQRSADQWKRGIAMQKIRLASLQDRIDQLNAKIRSEYGTVQYEAPYSRPLARQRERLAELQQQFDEQHFRLVEMQEAARRAGMHTIVYDP
jgi:hypothetical protein